ncbi:MAG: hypothetical protein ACOC1K_08015 [Nanoarchaeota archaeon]
MIYIVIYNDGTIDVYSNLSIIKNSINLDNVKEVYKTERKTPIKDLMYLQDPRVNTPKSFTKVKIK